MFWFILGALGFGALCALGSPRRQYTYNDNREYICENDSYDGGGGDCNDCD